MTIRRGVSYQKRATDINRIYDKYAKQGIPNREIWRRYIYPVYGIGERAFYYILKAQLNPRFIQYVDNYPSLFDFYDEQRPTKSNQEDSPRHSGGDE
jgi:hypothetical protein